MSLKRYELGEVLGKGGLGVVFRAYDTVLQRPVAVKLIRADREKYKSMGLLLREARAIAALRHPNVVVVYDIGQDESGDAFIAMELLDGNPLRAYVRSDAAPLAQKLRWLRDVADALAAAHESNLVHRDVKPDNVLVCKDGVVKVLDFGIAKRVVATPEGNEIASPSTAVTGFGTPAYMAPEQARGEPTTAAADQYAWGVMAYEVLTGIRPPPFRSIRGVLPEIPFSFAVAIERAFESKPEARWPSMRALVNSLGGAGDPTPRPEPPKTLPPTAREQPPTTTTSPVTSSSSGAETPTLDTPPAPPAPPPQATPLAQPGESTLLSPDDGKQPRRKKWAPVTAAVGVLAVGATAGVVLMLRGSGSKPAGELGACGIEESVDLQGSAAPPIDLDITVCAKKAFVSASRIDSPPLTAWTDARGAASFDDDFIHRVPHGDQLNFARTVCRRNEPWGVGWTKATLGHSFVFTAALTPSDGGTTFAMKNIGYPPSSCAAAADDEEIRAACTPGIDGIYQYSAVDVLTLRMSTVTLEQSPTALALAFLDDRGSLATVHRAAGLSLTYVPEGGIMPDSIRLTDAETSTPAVAGRNREVVVAWTQKDADAWHLYGATGSMPNKPTTKSLAAAASPDTPSIAYHAGGIAIAWTDPSGAFRVGWGRDLEAAVNHAKTLANGTKLAKIASDGSALFATWLEGPKVRLARVGCNTQAP